MKWKTKKSVVIARFEPFDGTLRIPTMNEIIKILMTRGINPKTDMMGMIKRTSIGEIYFKEKEKAKKFLFQRVTFRDVFWSTSDMTVLLYLKAFWKIHKKESNEIFWEKDGATG
jgi:hypothetical protein